jgi:sn-glycerol 3-phosphate transport system permease protein
MMALFLLSSLGAVVGAISLYLTLPASNPRRSFWSGLGAISGVLGVLLFMLPIKFCPFDADRPLDQTILGLCLVAVGMWITIMAVRGLARHGWAGLNAETQTEGLFPNPWLPWLLLAPTLLVLILFLYYPFLDTFHLSTLLASRTVSREYCLQNFTNLVVDTAYLNSVSRTFIFAGFILVGSLSLGLGIALLAFQPVKGAAIYRTLLIWPYAISPVVAGVIFRLMFNPNGGVINYITLQLFGTRFDWLNSPNLAAVVVILASIWTQLGFNILFYLAGLQNVPRDLLEAASIDGANAFQRFYRVLLPMLSPISFFLVITNLTFSFFGIFGTIDYLTEGGPLNATTVLIYNVFDTQRQNLGLGKAAAQSIVLFFVVVALTYIQFRTTERNVNYGA